MIILSALLGGFSAAMAHAQDKPGSVAAILEEIIALRERGQHSQAAARSELAIKQAAALPKNDSFRLQATIAQHSGLVNKLLAEGNFQRAGERAKSAVELAETKSQEKELLPVENYFRAQAYLDLAGVEFLRKNYSHARKLGEKIRSLPASKPAHAGQRAEAMLIVAGSDMQQGNWPQAEAVKLLAELQNLMPRTDPRYHQAQGLVFRAHAWDKLNLGANQQNAESIDEELEQFAGHIKTLTTELLRAGVEPAVASLGNLALMNAEYECRRLDRAGQTRKQVAVQENPTSVAPFYRGTFHNLAGLLDAEFGRYSAAGDHLSTAIKLAQQTGRPDLQAVVRNSIGQLLLRQGDYRAARRQLQAAVNLYERPDLEMHPGQAFAMINLAKCLEYDDALGEAADQIANAIDIIQNKSKFSSPAAQRHAMCLGLAARGVNAYSFGEPATARKSFEQLHELVKQHYGAGHLHSAESLVNLAWVDLEEQKYESAQSRFAEALQIILERYGEEHPRAAEIKGYLARALIASGGKAAAQRELLSAIKLRETTMRRAFQSALSERDRLALVQEMRVHPESMAWPGVFDSFIELAPDAAIDAAQQYDRVLAWKQVTNRDPQRRAIDSAHESELADLLSRQRQLAEDIRALYFSEASLEQQQEKRRRIAQLEEESRGVERQIEAISVESDDAQSETYTQAVQHVLAADTMLIDLIEIRRYRRRELNESVADERLVVAYVVDSNGVERIDLGGHDDIRRSLAAFRSALDRADPDYSAVQGALAQLFQPLLTATRRAKKLFIVPDGDLHSMPWGALPGSKPGSFLIEEKSIVLAPHAQRLLQKKMPASSQDMLVAGGVDYGNLKEWKPLVGSLTEARHVANLYRQASGTPCAPLLQREATERQLLSRMPRSKYVHLATHGFFSGDAMGRGFDIPELVSELESGLITAPARKNDNGRDQFLTAQEVAQLDLSGVELVVLSACQTGLGTVKSGQGTVGLLAALEEAGVGAAMTTLWPVRDQETQTFMKTFYHHLWKNRMSPAAALRATQLNCIRQQIKTDSGGSMAHPKNWAGFVLTGTHH